MTEELPVLMTEEFIRTEKLFRPEEPPVEKSLQEQIDNMQAQIDGLGKNVSTASQVESRYLYKGGEAKVFYGVDIKNAQNEGWLKAPAKD